MYQDLPISVLSLLPRVLREWSTDISQCPDPFFVIFFEVLLLF